MHDRDKTKEELISELQLLRRKLKRITAGIGDTALSLHPDDDSQENGESLRYILDGSNLGTWDWYMQSGKTVFNERWAQILGYTLEELQPVSIETWKKLAHPDDLGKSDRLIELHIAGETDYYDCECRMRHKNGHWIWVHDRGRICQRDSGGKPLRMSGIHMDITARKRMEEDLRRADEVLDRFFDHQQILVAYLDKDFNFIRVNRAYAENGKRSPESFAGKNHFDLYPDDENRAIFQKVVDAGKAFSVSAKPFVHPDQPGRGTTYWDWGLTPVKGPDGGVEGLVLILSDATDRVVVEKERQKFELELKRSEEKYRGLVEDMPVLVCRFRPDGAITFANREYCRFVGIDAGRAAEMSIYDFIPADEQAAVKKRLAGLSRQNPIASSENSVGMQTGNTRWQQWTDRALFNQQGELMEFQSVGIDITDVYTQQEIIEKQHDTLMHVLNQSPVGVVITDGEGVITLSNDTFLAVTGYKRGRLIGTGLHSLMYKDRKIRLEEGERLLDFTRSDGTVMNSRTTVFDLGAALYPEYRYACFINDIGLQVKLEKQQSRLQKQVESIIRELDNLNETFDETLKFSKYTETAVPNFTEVDRTIMRLIEQGKTNSEIAKKLKLAEITVKKRVSAIYRRLDIKNRYQLLEFLKSVHI